MRLHKTNTTYYFKYYNLSDHDVGRRNVLLKISILIGIIEFALRKNKESFNYIYIYIYIYIYTYL